MQAFKLSLTDEKAGSWNGAVGSIHLAQQADMRKTTAETT
jgi:hypothetical protein